VWQRYWDSRDRAFLMLGAAQDVQGPGRVRDVVSERGIAFPVLVDCESRLAGALGVAVVPAGFLVDDGVVRYARRDDFDIADPRVRWNLERFLAGEPVRPAGDGRHADREALRLFAVGATAYAGGRVRDAVAVWRRALERDPENFLIRSQIWAVEHPDRFYPAVDRDWQERQLLEEGYDGPLP